MTTQDVLITAKKCASEAIFLSYEQKDRAIELMAQKIEQAADEIIAENNKDLSDAKGKLSEAMLDRLKLDKDRIKSMTDGMRQVANLPDPVGKVLTETSRPNGLKIKKVSCPIGVLAVIYESRPNVTSDAAVLCFKSSNVCVLKPGKDSYRTAQKIVSAMRLGLKEAGINENFINIVPDPSRESATILMRAKGLVDALIPRGGAGLIKACVENSIVPCIETGTGICHIYVEKTADFNVALDIIENAKTSRPSVCNAAEVCLVDKDIANEFLPLLSKRLTEDRKSGGKIPVELRLDSEAQKIINGTKASDTDFDTEFLDYIMAVKIVGGVDGAIEHISLHSTHHSEAVITNNSEVANRFCMSVDSAAVYVNASTRFTDGGEFGLGCEMGISTQKLHARGPMGLSELTSYKYIINGNGQVR
ncbi:MAG: glutamate-5-semialdehyde dehydrogenase [Clostridia bacterium]|nr:glutamate-5-semialdehyde dehydrogenase [Clostridia bacterium]